MTLTEFLLARINEAETVALGVDDRDDTAAFGLDVHDEPGLGAELVVSKTRVLAECEAKRRIVEHVRGPEPRSVRETADGAMAYDYGDVLHFAPKETPPDLVLRLLALPYADHPDYDEKWRP